MNTETSKAVPLTTLLSGFINIPDNLNSNISQLHIDSRGVGEGGLFFALPGTLSDGRKYIPMAIEQGAGAIVYEARNAGKLDLDDRCFALDNLAHKVGPIASRFFGQPSQRMMVVGVTGTNGKTTCAHLIAQACHYLGSNCALIGTLGSGMIDAVNHASLTTPDAVTLQRLLHDFEEEGASCVVMEASSHGLEQGRVNGIDFDMALFTNLTHEHLDYHYDLESYGAAKSRLFQFETLSHAIVNIDDEFSRHLIASHKAKKLWTYGLSEGDFHLESSAMTTTGMQLSIATPNGTVEASSNLIGQFNIYNLLATFATLSAMGHDHQRISEALRAVNSVPGRMERVAGDQFQATVIVDFAHTPDALQNALTAAREHTVGKLWCIFGCGGDRDLDKRPKMGEIAAQLADYVVVTNDNPRSENPADIAAAIRSGMQQAPIVILDRKQAITYCLSRAHHNDTVLVAGKGHETTQILHDQVFEFSDREVVKAYLQEQLA